MAAVMSWRGYSWDFFTILIDSFFLGLLLFPVLYLLIYRPLSAEVSYRKKAEEQFRSIFDSSPNALVIVDVQGRITLVNAQAEKVFDYSREELLGHNIELLLPERFRAGHAHLVESYMADPIQKPLGIGRDLFARRKDGNDVPVEVALNPLRTEQGVFMLISVVDISERKRIQEERERLLEQAQHAVRLRDEFLSIASHELKTPLTSLHMQMAIFHRMLDQCAFESGEKKKVEELTRISHRQLERYSTLVDELLIASRLSSEGLTLNTEEVDLADAVRSAFERCKIDFERAGYKVLLTLEDGIRGRWDRERLKQLLSILLANAWKYGEGKPVEIFVSTEGDFAKLSVRDHGMGISEVDHARIFERFERAVSMRSFGGLGLGLYISRQIVEAHGGSIEVQSEQGKGSCFTVRLPKIANLKGFRTDVAA